MGLFLKVVAVFILLIPCNVSADETSHVRLLVHGKREIANSWGIATWFIGADVASNPHTWVFAIGPRYQTTQWWIEVLGGAVVAKGLRTPFIEIRSSLPVLIPRINSWINIRYVLPANMNRSQFYLYYRAGCALPFNIGQVGVETENMFRFGRDTLSLGPQIIIPSKSLTMVIAYQFHNRSTSEWWVRCLIDL